MPGDFSAKQCIKICGCNIGSHHKSQFRIKRQFDDLDDDLLIDDNDDDDRDHKDSNEDYVKESDLLEFKDYLNMKTKYIKYHPIINDNPDEKLILRRLDLNSIDSIEYLF